jgi:hypothetical protein
MPKLDEASTVSAAFFAMCLPHVDEVPLPMSGENELLLRVGAVEGAVFVVDRERQRPSLTYHLFQLQPLDTVWALTSSNQMRSSMLYPKVDLLAMADLTFG